MKVCYGKSDVVCEWVCWGQWTGLVLSKKERVERDNRDKGEHDCNKTEKGKCKEYYKY